MRVYFVRLILFALVLTSLPACGSNNTATASGEVFADGEPLPSATITFVPMRGGGARTGSVVNGAFRVEAVLGKNRVEILAPPPVPPGYEKKDAATVPPEVRAKLKYATPPRYNAQSTLSAEVKAGDKNHFKFELKSD